MARPGGIIRKDSLRGSGEVKKLIIAEDLTALGQISLVTALGVVQALDVRPASLPTTVLSTQSEGFGTPVALATRDWTAETLARWQGGSESFDGILVGYVGSIELGARLRQLLRQIPAGVKLVDPVLGDRGRLYPGFGPDQVALVKELCREATVITPNWTELCLLAGADPATPATLDQTAELIHRLPARGINARVVVTGIDSGAGVTTAYGESAGPLTRLVAPAMPGHFYGSGDLFAAIFAALLVKGWSFADAVTAAQEGVSRAIERTAPLPEEERRYGLAVVETLHYLSGLAERGPLQRRPGAAYPGA